MPFNSLFEMPLDVLSRWVKGEDPTSFQFSI